MFFPHHPDNVAQQVSPALQPEPHSKINDTGKRVGLSSLGFDAPPPPRHKSPSIRISGSY